MNYAQAVCDALDELDRTPFGDMGKALDKISDLAVKSAQQAVKLEARIDITNDDWYPIESAPKNNTRILLWYPWRGEPVSFAPAGFHYVATWTCTEVGDFDWRDPDSLGLIGANPTHWKWLSIPTN